MQFNISAEHKHASGVYIIRNSVNEKVYVGSAVNFWRRYRKHWSELERGKHHSHHIQRFSDKEGIETLSFELLEATPLEKDIIIQCEQKWIDVLDCCNRSKGFNMAPTAGSLLGYKHSEETRQVRLGRPLSEETKRKISEAHKGKIQKPFTPEQRERQREAVRAAGRKQKGKPKKPFTPEQRERQREAVRAARRGKVVSEAHKLKLSLERKGKKRNPEIGKKVSAALQARLASGKPLGRPLGTKLTDEQRRRLSEARKGKPLTNEHRKKISEAQKGMYTLERRKAISEKVTAIWAARKADQLTLSL